jgi:hypothetical protein
MISLLQPLRLRLGCLLLGWGERLLNGVATGMAEAPPNPLGGVDPNRPDPGGPGSDPAAAPAAASLLEGGQPPSAAVSQVHAPPSVSPPQLTSATRRATAAARPTDPARDPAAHRAADPAVGPNADQPLGPAAEPSDAAPLTPALRPPVSIEKAVLNHDLRVLRREAADALAALGAAHALVSSARLAQVQELRQQIGEGHVSEDTLLSLAADYQGWVNDQVRLFDALSLVMRMRIPAGRVLEQVDPAMRPQACNHLEMLCLEYERQQLNQRFPRQSSSDEDLQG